MGSDTRSREGFQEVGQGLEGEQHGSHTGPAGTEPKRLVQQLLPRKRLRGRCPGDLTQRQAYQDTLPSCRGTGPAHPRKWSPAPFKPIQPVQRSASRRSLVS